ncbi:MAG: pyridoxal phosphate-dependent decarboxylase family protein [Acidimicrobiales bacterium]
MFSYDAGMTDLVFDYCRERLRFDPVSLDFPGDKATLDRVLEGLLRPEGNDPAAVLTLFEDHLATAVISCDSPRFLSFVPAAPTKASLLFDMVVSCSSLQGTSWLEAAGAVAAENQVIRLIADRAGLPPSAGGCFVSGGSAGNLSSLVVARDTAARRGFAGGGRVRVAVSDQAHSSIRNALSVIGAGALIVPTPDDRLTGAALADALAADAAAGGGATAEGGTAVGSGGGVSAGGEGEVVAVVATAGTTNAGIIDDLAGVAEVAAANRLWFHVDGAYGGAGLFSTSARARYRGIEAADSFVVDPHKWLYAPFDCATLIYREPWLAKAVHTQDASYLDVIHNEVSEWNPSDYAYHLTRRARGLALWFSLAVYGTDAYAAAVDASLDLARRVADRIDGTDHLELLRRPDLSVVLFRRPGWTEADYYAWSSQLLADQIGFAVPTKWDGETVARFCFLHPDTTMEMVAEMLAPMA